MALLRNGKHSPSANLACKTFLPSLPSLFSRPWLVDIGATDRTIFFKKKEKRQILSNLKPILLANKDLVPVSGVYDLQLSLSLQSQKVLCVPSLLTIFFSVSTSSKSLNFSITFFLDHCLFQDLHSMKMNGVGKQQGGLYFLQPKATAANTLSESPNFGVWHWRLGHPSIPRLQHLA